MGGWMNGWMIDRQTDNRDERKLMITINRHDC